MPYRLFNDKGNDVQTGDGVMLAVDVSSQEGRAFAHIYASMRRAGFAHEKASKEAYRRAIDPR